MVKSKKIEESVSLEDGRWEYTKQILNKKLEDIPASQRAGHRPCAYCKKVTAMRTNQEFCSALCKTRYHNLLRASRLEAALQRIQELERLVISLGGALP